MCCRRVYVYAGLSSDVLNKYWEYIGQRSCYTLINVLIALVIF